MAPPLISAAGGAIDGPIRATPLARRIAAAHGLDLADVVGAGWGGRVTKRDVEQRLATDRPRPAPPGRARGAPTMTATPIAERRLGSGPSTSAAPTAWMLVEADLTPLLRAIARHGDAFRQREAADLTPLAAVAFAVALELRRRPLLNAAWAGDAIRLRRSIALAVVTDDRQALIPRAEQLTLADLARALAGPASTDLTPASFTIVASPARRLVQPTLPSGQAACLALGAATSRPTVVDDAIAVRSIAALSVVFDHRVLDGAPVGAFLRTVKGWLEGDGPAALEAT